MKTEANGGSTSRPHPSIEVMSRASVTSPGRSLPAAEQLMGELVGGAPGRALRVELAQSHPRRSPEEVDDAVQTACERFVGLVTEASSPGQIYNWVRTVARNLLADQDAYGYGTREIPVDPVEGILEQAPARGPDPVEEIIAREEGQEMEALARELVDSLSGREREILALRFAGYRRAEIGERLGLSARAVERALLKIMAELRADFAERLGGGCIVGEPLVQRLVYGLATSAEAAQARLHLKGCHRCDSLYERLVEWREKAAAILPAPAIEAASPGTFERVGQRVADAVGSAKQQILGAGAQAKQQASATFYRSVDPMPLAGIRPGAVAAVVASCIAIGGGAAAYCANQGVDPIGAATGLIAGSEEDKTEPPPSNQPEAQEASPTPTYEPSPTPTYEAEEQTTEAPQTESSAPAEKSEPEPTTSEPATQSEGEFEPIEETAPEPEPEVPATEASPEPTASAKQPAPVQSSSGAGEFEP
jgi:RNA polymerase sigma factor (sigma-70 family)